MMTLLKTIDLMPSALDQASKNCTNTDATSREKMQERQKELHQKNIAFTD